MKKKKKKNHTKKNILKNIMCKLYFFIKNTTELNAWMCV